MNEEMGKNYRTFRWAVNHKPGAVDDKYMFTNGDRAVVPDQQELKYSISDPEQCTISIQQISSNIRIYLIFPETRVIGLNFAADNMDLCLILFTRLSLKVEPCECKRADTKTEFDMKCQCQK